MYRSRCTAKNSWWWAERLSETCRVVIRIKLEFSASVGFIHKVHYDIRYCSVGFVKWVPWSSTVTKTLVIYFDWGDRREGLSLRCAIGLIVLYIDTRFPVLWCHLSHHGSLESVVVFVFRCLCYACAATVLLLWDPRNSIYWILLLVKQRGSSARRFCVSWDTHTQFALSGGCSL